MTLASCSCSRPADRRVLPAVIATLALCATGCATLVSGSRQTIAVASEPPGATVYVNGANMGPTPAKIQLERKATSTVVRLERDGYEPRTIEMTRHTNGWIAADVLWGASEFLNQGVGFHARVIGAVVVTAATLVLDYRAGAVYRLEPGAIKVVLEKR